METILELAATGEDREQYLVRQAQEGSRAAFDALFRRHRQFIFNVCRQMLGSEEDAVDATQAAFIQAYRGLRGFRGGASFRSWVCRIAINVSNSMLRKEQRRKTLAPRPDEYAERHEPDEEVRGILREMPEQLRTVLVFSYFQGLSGQEIADVRGCSPGAVRTRLHRARVAFKKRFEELRRR